MGFAEGRKGLSFAGAAGPQHIYPQELGQYTQDWIPRVLGEVGPNMKLDKKEYSIALSGNTGFLIPW